MRSVKGDAEKRVSARSILWVEAGYLSTDEASDLHQRIDAGIVAVEKFLGFKFSREAYGQEKIEFFVHSRRAPSHTITAYSPRKYMHPVVFLSYAKGKRTPYLHETVHIIAWDWNTLWLKEGLAVHLNDRLGGYAAFPNFGERWMSPAGCSPPRVSAAMEALDLVGENGIQIREPARARMFYISRPLVASFCAVGGWKKFMRVLRHQGRGAAILRKRETRVAVEGDVATGELGAIPTGRGDGEYRERNGNSPQRKPPGFPRALFISGLSARSPGVLVCVWAVLLGASFQRPVIFKT